MRLIKNNQQRLNRLHIVLDAFFIMIAYVLAWFIKMRSGLLSTSGEVLPVETYMAALIFVITFSICIRRNVNPDDAQNLPISSSPIRSDCLSLY